MRAFCPGHITGFFTVETDDADPLISGSRGVGFCVDAGAIADLSIIPSEKMKMEIMINGDETDAPVTRRAIELLLPDGRWHVKANLETQAPISQGCGLSAAGTFATCLAIAETLELPEGRHAAMRATHVAEISSKTGLGDVVAQNIGGVVQRHRPGIPPFGEVKAIKKSGEDVVICVLGPPLSTSSVISSDELKRQISDIGSKCLDEFDKNPDFNAFLKLSKRFALETGLVTPRMEEALDNVSEIGDGSVVMLGNSIFVFGDAGEIEERLQKFGRIIKTKISDSGARLLD